jgi:hypothetical protein
MTQQLHAASRGGGNGPIEEVLFPSFRVLGFTGRGLTMVIVVFWMGGQHVGVSLFRRRE